MPIFEGIGKSMGGMAVLAGLAGEGGGDTAQDAANVWRDLQAANYDYRSLTPIQLQTLATAYPEVYNAIGAPDPATIQEGTVGREAQVTGVQELTAAAKGGVPLVDRLASQRAETSAMESSRGMNEAVLQNLARRGQLGSGDEVQARLAANQGAQNQAAQMGSQIASDAALRRLAAAGAAGQAGGQLRAADEGLSAQNANIANQFTQAFVNRQQQASNANTQARQAAQLENLRRTQGVADANAQNAYAAAQFNVTNQNQLRGQAFDDRVTQAKGYTGQLGQIAAREDAEMAAKAQGFVDVGGGTGAAVDDVWKMYASGGASAAGGAGGFI